MKAWKGKPARRKGVLGELGGTKGEGAKGEEEETCWGNCCQHWDRCVEEQQRTRANTDAKGGLRTAWACQCLAPSSWDAHSGGKDLTVQTYLKCRDSLAQELPVLSIETLALSPLRENSWLNFIRLSLTLLLTRGVLQPAACSLSRGICEWTVQPQQFLLCDEL